MSANQTRAVLVYTSLPFVTRCRRCSLSLDSRRRYWFALTEPVEFVATCARCARDIFGSSGALRDALAKSEQGILTELPEVDWP